MATRNCANCSYAEVNNAVNGVAGGGGTWTGNPADDHDIINLPAGSATWTSTLFVTANIQLVGAGEDDTIITENLTRTGNPSLINVNLSHESAAPNYSFRLSGMQFTSQVKIGTKLGGDAAFIQIKGLSHATDSPPPVVRGCVARVRLDHLKLISLNGIFIGLDSVLGVGDHITCNETATSYVANTMRIWHATWTPDLNPDTGLPLPTSYTAAWALGSWADDAYWGTSKFFFFEDCNFTMPSNTNATDDEEGARTVFRHCTFNGGGGLASHGMEGRKEAGIRAREVYNNYFITDRILAQHRSGGCLYFNNKSTDVPSGFSFKVYRNTRMQKDWGHASGDNRYDDNVGGAALYTGTVTATNGTTSITGSNANFSLINLTDGFCYGINNLDAPYTLPYTPFTTNGANDVGWQWMGNAVIGVSGQVLTLDWESGFSPTWSVGNHYEIRKVAVCFGQPGQAKGKLLNSSATGQGAYTTWFYPNTSGAKATYPQAGFPLDPLYSWNNTDNTNGYLGFVVSNAKSLKLNRDYFNLAERTIATQNVGWPAQTYLRATNDYPDIGENSDIPYTPFVYPHPLTGATLGKILTVPLSHAYGNVIIGETVTYEIPASNDGDATLHVSAISFPTGYSTPDSTSFDITPGATVFVTSIFSPVAAIPYNGQIIFASDADAISAGNEVMDVTGTGVLPSGGGGTGKGHKKGVLVSRSRT